MVEARLIHRLQPRYNRQGTQWRAAPFVALTLGERFPRLKVVREPRADGSLYLGPLPSPRQAAAVVEAIQTVVAAAALHRAPRAPDHRSPSVPTRACPPSSAWPTARAPAGRIRRRTPPPVVHRWSRG